MDKSTYFSATRPSAVTDAEAENALRGIMLGTVYGCTFWMLAIAVFVYF